MSKPGRPAILLQFPDDVLARYTAGELNHHDVGRLFGVSANVALRELRRAGMDTSRSTRKLLQHSRRVGLTELYDAIPRLYGLGLSLREVGAQFGLTQEGVRQILLRRGDPIRPPQGAARPQGTDQPGTRRFARRLRRLRTAAGMTQGELAALSQLSRQTISLLERGARLPSSETLARLAECFGLGVQALAESLPSPAPAFSGAEAG